MLMLRRALLGMLLVLQISATAAAGLIDADSFRPLTGDRRAYRPGDPLVVQVAESTVAESSAATGSRNDASFRAQLMDTTSDHRAGFGTLGADHGAGQTARKGRAFTQISARITQVLANGVLQIEGQHTLVINGEQQRISVSGVVRAEDIGPDNTVWSNRVADARIVIVGSGDVDRARKPRLLTRVRQWLGL